MIVAPFRVVLDANVLFPFTVRDTLLRATAAGLFQVYWSAEILDETTRNLVATGTTTQAQADRLRAQLVKTFPEAMVVGHETLVASMQNDPKDRHVVAAAVKAGAQIIVTSNLRDFRPLPDAIEAQSPDHFLCDVLDLSPADVLELLADQAAALKRPAKTLEELLTGLAKTVPNFVAAVRERKAAMLRESAGCRVAGVELSCTRTQHDDVPTWQPRR